MRACHPCGSLTSLEAPIVRLNSTRTTNLIRKKHILNSRSCSTSSDLTLYHFVTAAHPSSLGPWMYRAHHSEAESSPLLLWCRRPFQFCRLTIPWSPAFCVLLRFLRGQSLICVLIRKVIELSVLVDFPDYPREG